MNEGSKILFRVMLAFFKMVEEQILQLTDIGELTQFLNTERRLLFDADKLIDVCTFIHYQHFFTYGCFTGLHVFLEFTAKTHQFASGYVCQRSEEGR